MQPGRATGSNPVLPQSHSQQRPNGGFFASISAKDLSGGTPLQRTIISTYGHTSPEVVTQASDRIAGLRDRHGNAEHRTRARRRRLVHTDTGSFLLKVRPPRGPLEQRQKSLREVPALPVTPGLRLGILADGMSAAGRSLVWRECRSRECAAGADVPATIHSRVASRSAKATVRDIAVLVRPASDEGRPKECRHARVHGQSCRRILQTGGQIARR